VTSQDLFRQHLFFAHLSKPQQRKTRESHVGKKPVGRWVGEDQEQGQEKKLGWQVWRAVGWDNQDLSFLRLLFKRNSSIGIHLPFPSLLPKEVMRLYLHHEPSDFTLVVQWQDNDQGTIGELKKVRESSSCPCSGFTSHSHLASF
jgi:hypothetical protein